MKPEVADIVASRDGGCVAPIIGPPAVGPCFDEWGRLMVRTELRKCERDHWDPSGRGKNRADATADQVIIGCSGHHRGTGPVRPGQGWLATKAGRRAIETYIAAWIEAGRPRHFAGKHLTQTAADVS